MQSGGDGWGPQIGMQGWDGTPKGSGRNNARNNKLQA